MIIVIIIKIHPNIFREILQSAKQNGCSGRCIGKMVCLPDAYRFWRRLKCCLKIKTIVGAVHQNNASVPNISQGASVSSNSGTRRVGD